MNEDAFSEKLIKLQEDNKKLKEELKICNRRIRDEDDSENINEYDGIQI